MQVYVFGSVPLKTYLPDGDVDITVLTNTHVDSAFIDDVYCLLRSEETNDDAQFALKDVKIINAKVHFLGYTPSSFFRYYFSKILYTEVRFFVENVLTFFLSHLSTSMVIWFIYFPY